MAAVNKALKVRQILKIRKERRQKQLRILHFIISRIRKLLQLCISMLSIVMVKPRRPRIRTCRRLERKTTWQNWWTYVWTGFSDKRFKNTFPIPRATFVMTLDKIRDNLLKDATTEEPIYHQNADLQFACID